MIGQQTWMVGYAVLTAAVTQFVAEHQRHGIWPWLHLPGLYENTVPEDLGLTPPETRSIAADGHATVATALTVVFTSAQNDLADNNSKNNITQPRLCTACLSQLELILCCLLLVRSITTVWVEPNEGTSICNSTFADAYSIFADKLVPASKQCPSCIRLSAQTF